MYVEQMTHFNSFIGFNSYGLNGGAGLLCGINVRKHVIKHLQAMHSLSCDVLR